MVQGDLRCASQSVCAVVSKSVLERVQDADMLVGRRLLLSTALAVIKQAPEDTDKVVRNLVKVYLILLASVGSL